MRASQKRALRQKALRWGRLAVQVAFFIALPSLFSAGFNGFKYLFTSMGTAAPIEATSFLLTLAVLLGVTIVLGRVFCGFACAFGTLGDVLHGLFSFAWSKTPLPPLVFPDKLVRALSLVKYAVLVLIGIACFAGVWAAVSSDSPWVAFAGILSGQVEGINVAAFVILGLLCVGMMVRERFFCQFFCPLGALFSLMPALGPVGFTRNPARCPANCGRCRKSCPVGIWPDADTPLHGECIACGRCAAVCPLDNVSPLCVGARRREDAAFVARSTPARAFALMAAGLGLSVALTAGAALGAVGSYEPVEFDPAAYEPPAVPVVDLQTRDLPEERGGVATLELTMPRQALEGTLKDGTYTGAALCGAGNDEDWQPYYILVDVEVRKGRIQGITDIRGDAEGAVDRAYRYDAAENSLYLDRAVEGTGGRFSKGALDQIEAFIESGEEQGGVDTVSGSTYSVVSIVQAYNRAVSDAVEQSGR